MEALGTTARDVATREALQGLESFLTGRERLGFGAGPAPRTSVLLVLHGRAELTLRCLLALRATRVPFELVIVDNASTDATPRLLERLDGVTVLRNATNPGFLRAANQAAGRAGAPLLLFLNNDCELLPGSLECAVSRLESARDVGAVVGRLLALDGRLQEAGGIVWSDGTCSGYGRGDQPDAPAYMFERDVDFGSGAFLLTPRAVFERMGGFDEALAPAYYEDADYGLRLWAAGLRVVYEPRATARHFEFASAASVEDALAQQAARRPLFFEKHRAALSRQAAPDPRATLAARARVSGLKVLWVDDRVPHASLGQGYPRALAIVEALRRLGHQVTLYPLLFPTESWDSVYTALPPDVEVMTGLGRDGFEAFREARAGHYDVAFVSRAGTLEALRKAGGAGPLFGTTPWIYDGEALEGRAGELEASRQARAVTSVSAAEAEVFRGAGHASVTVLGHALAAAPTPAGFAERSGLLFAGAIPDDASPNADAVVWLVNEVMPRLRALGVTSGLTLAGINGSRRVTALLGADVRHAGPVRSLAPLYDRARVFVAPGRRAAGIPLKILDAAGHGLPVVTTPVLAAQLGWPAGEALLSGADPDAFARACAALETDADLWSRLRSAGLARIRTECDPEAFERSLGDLLQAVAPHSGAAPCQRSAPARAAATGPHPAHVPDDRSDRIAQLEHALAAARHDLRALRASFSWRLTAPLRAVHARLRGRG